VKKEEFWNFVLTQKDEFWKIDEFDVFNGFWCFDVDVDVVVGLLLCVLLCVFGED